MGLPHRQGSVESSTIGTGNGTTVAGSHASGSPNASASNVDNSGPQNGRVNLPNETMGTTELYQWSPEWNSNSSNTCVNRVGGPQYQ